MYVNPCVTRMLPAEEKCCSSELHRESGINPLYLSPRGLYKLSHMLPEAQELPAGQHWTKGLTPCPQVLRHAIPLQVIKQAMVPDVFTYGKAELTSVCCLKEMVQAALF